MAAIAIGLGVSIGTTLLINALFPPPKIKALDDLTTLKSEYGVEIPRVYGTVRLGGNVIWATDKEERERKNNQIKYYGTFAVLFCEGELEEVGKIWANNKVIADLKSTDPAVQKETNKLLDEYLEIYYGSDTQLASPTIQGLETIQTTPSFKGLVYLVFRFWSLKDYGNAIPKIEIEAVKTLTPPTLQEVIDDVLTNKSNLLPSQWDSSDLASVTVRGVKLKQNGQSIREFIEDLQRVYRFIAVEVDGVIKFELLGNNTTPLVIPIEDLGTKEVGSEPVGLYKDTKTHVIDLPNEVTVEFFNGNNGYNRSIQTAIRSDARHIHNQKFSTTCVLTDSEAATSARQILDYIWVKRNEYTDLTLPPSYIFDNNTEQGQVLLLPIGNDQVLVQIKERSIGANLEVNLTCLSFNLNIVNEQVIIESEDNYSISDSVSYYGINTPIALDIPLVNDTDLDFGVYVSALPDSEATDVTQGVITSYVDGATSVEVLNDINSFVASATTSTVFPDGNPYVIDRQTVIEVNQSIGTPLTLTNFEFFNFGNIAYINGELIAFQTVTFIAANVYEISNIVRGIKGTEHLIANHAIGSDLIILKGGNIPIDVPRDANFLGQLLYFRVAYEDNENNFVIGASSDVLETSLTLQGNRIRPYRPTHPKLTLAASGDITITWTRRTRKNGQWSSTTETVPVNQETESYRLEILNGATVVRSVNGLSNPFYFYNTASQVLDFGSTQTQLSFRIYQISNIVGDSEPLERTNFNPTFYSI